jgi:predicted nuclease with TOPRIM domain
LLERLTSALRVVGVSCGGRGDGDVVATIEETLKSQRLDAERADRAIRDVRGEILSLQKLASALQKDLGEGERRREGDAREILRLKDENGILNERVLKLQERERELRERVKDLSVRKETHDAIFGKSGAGGGDEAGGDLVRRLKAELEKEKAVNVELSLIACEWMAQAKGGKLRAPHG